MPQPRLVRDLAAELLRLYAQITQRIGDEQARIIAEWPRIQRAVRLQRLEDLRSLVTQLTAAADEQALAYAQSGIGQTYLLGAQHAATVAGAPVPTVVNQGAVTQVASDTYSDLLAATTAVSVSTKLLIRTLARDHVADVVVTGQTAVQAGRDLAAQITEQGRGVRSVTYANGARMPLDSYAEMVVRTKSATAYNTGSLAQAGSLGIDLVQCLDGNGCGLDGHDDPVLADGLVMPWQEALGYLISHPNCVRSWIPRADAQGQDPGSVDSLPSFAQETDLESFSPPGNQRVAAREDRLASRRATIDARTAARAGG